MHQSRIVRPFIWITCLLLIAFPVLAQAQSGKGAYEPIPYQDGKDVVWVPTEQALTDKMLDLARVTPQDYVIDLGSGDGRIVITAARRGARALGIEYDPNMIALSRQTALKAGVADKAKFVQADLFESDFSQATVITMFLLPEINLKLRPRILDLAPGTRIVSNSFDMKEWEADKTVDVAPEEGCRNNFCTAYFWIVPAKVEGVWKLPEGRLTLRQQFQRLYGTLQSDGQALPVANGKLTGDRISFTIGNKRYSGRVTGETIRGSVAAAGKKSDWNADRISPRLF